jgi:hypothetical protein
MCSIWWIIHEKKGSVIILVWAENKGGCEVQVINI